MKLYKTCDHTSAAYWAPHIAGSCGRSDCYGDFYRAQDVISMLKRVLPCVEWHIQDGDECGVLARDLEAEIKAIIGDEK